MAATLFDIQSQIDAFLKKNPKVLEYVEWIRYVPQGNEVPEGTSHTLKLADRTNDDLVMALKAKAPFGALADALLKVL